MCEVKTVFVLILIELVFGQKGKPPLQLRPCRFNRDILVTLDPRASPEENQYILNIYETIPKGTTVNLKFDSDANIELTDRTEATITTNKIENLFHLFLTESAANLTITVRGPATGPIPHLISMEILNGEYCVSPQKVHHVGLVVNGSPTKPGDWPWHAAIYQLDRSRIDYICGGTLLNKFIVVTAGHCVTLRGVAVVPESRNVILGKYNLVGGDVAPQERGVFQIIVHEGYLQNVLDHDIALMKLKSEAIYNDYVQPACLWHSDISKQMPQENIQGTVVGWGFDQTDSLATTLQQATVPIVSELQCIKSNPVFYTRLLNEYKFCAGHGNGTSACNGDSGGGFLVFVPDNAGTTTFNAYTGSWFLRGIVSLSVSRSDAPICDPNQYVIFVDVAKYKDWLDRNMN